MQDPKSNIVQSSEQQALPTTTPYGNFLYSAASSYPVDSNRGPYGVMAPYGMYPISQWPPTEGLNVNSNMTGGPITTASDMTSLSSTATNNIPIMSANQAASVPSNLNMVSNSSAVANNMPAAYMNTPAYGMGNYCVFPMSELENNVITLSSSVLYPPNTYPAPIQSPKPFDCSSILVGGLPEMATEELVKEVFERCGEIVSVRLKRNSYVVEFLIRHSVDRALGLHGWMIKIENKEDVAYTGTLHIDYHDDKAPDQPGRISPQAFVQYSKEEISSVLEKLDDENDFDKAVQILTLWLEKGECSKRNASSFYSAIQKTNNRVQKLMNEKAKFEENLHKAKSTLNDKILGMTSQLKEFEKVLETTRLQKVWDHLSKAQRKNIDLWGKEISEIKESCVNELIDDRIEDEMEMSDDEGIRSGSEDGDKDELGRLKEQLDDLQNEFQAAEEEMKDIQKDKLETVQTLRNDFHEACAKITENKEQVEEFKKLLEQRSEMSDSIQESVIQPKKRRLGADIAPDIVVPKCVALSLEMAENDIQQIGLIATFLNAHPFGASLDYIASYLGSMDTGTSARDIENLMKQLPTVFKEESLGIGSSLRKMWKFWGFGI